MVALTPVAFPFVAGTVLVMMTLIIMAVSAAVTGRLFVLFFIER